MLPKIPDDIYNNRCQYCIHFIEDKENREIQRHEIWRCSDNPCPCKIQSIAQYKHQEHDEDWREFWYVPYDDGECRSFTPLYGYPICYYCEYHNSFMKEQEYCTITPKNRRIAVIGNQYGGEHWQYAYMICDKWKLDSSWRKRALEKVARGRLPAIFDPNTFKLLKPAKENKVAEKWAVIVKEQKEKLQKEAELLAEEKKTDENGQYKLL